MKLFKAIVSMVLSSVILLSIVAAAPTALANTGSELSSKTFSDTKELSIFLKNEDETLELRQTVYRWNVKSSVDIYNAVIHLDNGNGNNCEMDLEGHKVDGVQYYAIKQSDSRYYIDTEGNNSKEGEVLHQYHSSYKQDNQLFRFVPVEGEQDTYYIMTRNGDKADKDLYVGTQDNKVGQHVKLVTTSTPTKWIVSPGDKAYLTGEETALPSYDHPESPSQKDYTVVTLSPNGSVYDVNVHRDNVPAVGNDLHLYYIGTSSKFRLEYVSSQEAYRLWCLDLDENNLLGGTHFVWDIGNASVDPGAQAHIWTKEGDDHLSQMWRFISVPGQQDVYYIYNCNSKLYLSLKDAPKELENGIILSQSETPMEWKMTFLNALDHETEAKTWMAAIADDTPLCSINIPGTHDAGANNMVADLYPQQSKGKAQQLYLDEQLNVGVRAWDIRIDATQHSDDPDIIHGYGWTQCQNANDDHLRLSDVMDTAKAFLEKYPSETIIMTIKEDGHILAQEHIAPAALEGYINGEKGDYPIWTGGENVSLDYIPTLGEVRGKIVFIRRYSLDGYDTDTNLTYFGLDASSWDDFDYSDSTHYHEIHSEKYDPVYDRTQDDVPPVDDTYQLYSKIWVQDDYGEKDADEKLKSFYDTIAYATANHMTHSISTTDEGYTVETRTYLFNYSGATDDLDQPRAINFALMSCSELEQPATQDAKKVVGIVMTNYIDARLAERIYKTNFVAGQVSFPHTAYLTYGQTLSEAVFEGGSGAGQFRFKDGQQIPAAGIYEGDFEVEFIPDGADGQVITQAVKLVVAKKALDYQAKALTMTFGDKTPQASEFFPGLQDLAAQVELKDQNGTVADPDKLLAAGVYEVVVKLDDPNYELEKATGITLTVEKRTVALEWTGDREFVYDGKAKSVSAKVTNLVTDGDGTVYACEVQVFGGTATAPGIYTATVTGLTSDNYRLPDQPLSVTYTIKEAPTAIVITVVAISVVLCAAVVFGIVLARKRRKKA